MKKKIIHFLTALVVANLMACGNSEENADKNNKTESTSDQNEPKKSVSIKQKITPSLWVETKDAKEVVDYYLSIFKDGKLNIRKSLHEVCPEV